MTVTTPPYRLECWEERYLPCMVATANTLDELMGALLGFALVLNHAGRSGQLVGFCHQDGGDRQFLRYWFGVRSLERQEWGRPTIAAPWCGQG